MCAPMSPVFSSNDHLLFNFPGVDCFISWSDDPFQLSSLPPYAWPFVH